MKNLKSHKKSLSAAFSSIAQRKRLYQYLAALFLFIVLEMTVLLHVHCMSGYIQRGTSEVTVLVKRSRRSLAPIVGILMAP